MQRLREALLRLACVGYAVLAIASLALAACVPTTVQTSRVMGVGGGRYSVSGIVEGSSQYESSGEAIAYQAAVRRARRFCKARKGREAKIESRSGTASSDGQGSMETATDTQRIYFRCGKPKKDKRRRVKKSRSERTSKKKTEPSVAFAEPAGGAIGSVAIERWVDKATSLPFARFRYTFEYGAVLNLVVRSRLDGSISSHVAISIVTESHADGDFDGESLMALEVNGATIAALDTVWSVRHRPGQIVQETLEATFPVTNLVDSPNVIVSFKVRASILEATLAGDALAKFREFLALVKSGQLAGFADVAPTASPTTTTD